MNYPLYTTHAHLWSLLSPLESYESEMVEWCGLVEQHFAENLPTCLLDLGSGGGHHLYHLFSGLPDLEGGVAVDLAGEMLNELTRLLPRVECHTADMTTFRSERRFDLITVHDSFCYLTNEQTVASLFDTVAHHLNPGGLALIKLDAIEDDFEGPYRYLTSFEQDDSEVTLTHYEWDPNPGDNWLEVIYLFLERAGSEMALREERHRLGLFSKEGLLSLVRASGLHGSFHSLERWDEDRENLLLVVTKPEDGAR